MTNGGSGGGTSPGGWTAPSIERALPQLISPERQALEEWLDYERNTLLIKCSGLTGNQLVMRAVHPSNLSLLGIVRHMTEVERWWFRMNAAKEQVGWRYCEEKESADFDDLDPGNAEADLAALREEIEASKLAVAGMSLDESFASAGHHPERVRDLRWVYVHMVEEYARHNGHADLLRESIDGKVGF